MSCQLLAMRTACYSVFFPWSIHGKGQEIYLSPFIDKKMKLFVPFPQKMLHSNGAIGRLMVLSLSKKLQFFLV